VNIIGRMHMKLNLKNASRSSQYLKFLTLYPMRLNIIRWMGMIFVPLSRFVQMQLSHKTTKSASPSNRTEYHVG